MLPFRPLHSLHLYFALLLVLSGVRLMRLRCAEEMTELVTYRLPTLPTTPFPHRARNLEDFSKFDPAFWKDYPKVSTSTGLIIRELNALGAHARRTHE